MIAVHVIIDERLVKDMYAIISGGLSGGEYDSFAFLYRFGYGGFSSSIVPEKVIDVCGEDSGTGSLVGGIVNTDFNDLAFDFLHQAPSIAIGRGRLGYPASSKASNRFVL